MWIYPHSLSYFNELAGGPNNGHAHLLDSNIDWGQDLLFLRDWMNNHPESEPLTLAYYGLFDPSAVGFEYQVPTSMLRDTESIDAKTTLESGWYAVSVHILRGGDAAIPLPDGTWRSLSRDACSQLRAIEPVAKAGYSIYIIHLPQPAVPTSGQTNGRRSVPLRATLPERWFHN
jgi:hypothetical protein